MLCAVVGAFVGACVGEQSYTPIEDTDRSDEGGTIFNSNRILEDDFYTDSSMTAAQMQEFLEVGPYNCRPVWLADEEVNGIPASDLIIDASKNAGVNPLMVLARVQVEQSLISKSETPFDTDHALGCHDPISDPEYPNGLTPRIAPLDMQLECATATLRNRFQDSVDRTGAWQKGVEKLTLDKIAVTPENHATAALYAYTPFVAEGTGGNWLVWNVSNKFERHFSNLRNGEACK